MFDFLHPCGDVDGGVWLDEQRNSSVTPKRFRLLDLNLNAACKRKQNVCPGVYNLQF